MEVHIVADAVSSRRCVSLARSHFSRLTYEFTSLSVSEHELWCCPVSLRSQTDRLFALSRLKQSGAYLNTTEGVLLQLVQDAKHPNFKEVLLPLVPHDAHYSALSLRHLNRRSETPEGSHTPDCEVKEKKTPPVPSHATGAAQCFKVSCKRWDSWDNTCVPPSLLCPVLWVIKDRAGSFSPPHLWCWAQQTVP